MEMIDTAIHQNLWLAFVVLIVAFAILAKCADLFVDGAVGIAYRLNVPKLVIGIVLVSLATTAPELTVSLMASLRGQPEMALGNAIGSVICDDGLALALAAIFSATPLLVIPNVIKVSGTFLVSVMILLFIFIYGDYTLSRIEGITLVTLFIGYLALLYTLHKKGKFKDVVNEEIDVDTIATLYKLSLLFLVGILGIVVSSDMIVKSATSIALSFGIPESMIALTLVAFGTSIPEVATCVAAVTKKEGAIAVGNIIGADILNLVWVAGASSIVNDLVLEPPSFYFMFPWMFIVVGTMLFFLTRNYRLTRRGGIVLLLLYISYLASFIILFPPSLEVAPHL